MTFENSLLHKSKEKTFKEDQDHSQKIAQSWLRAMKFVLFSLAL